MAFSGLLRTTSNAAESTGFPQTGNRGAGRVCGFRGGWWYRWEGMWGAAASTRTCLSGRVWFYLGPCIEFLWSLFAREGWPDRRVLGEWLLFGRSVYSRVGFGVVAEGLVSVCVGFFAFDVVCEGSVIAGETSLRDGARSRGEVWELGAEVPDEVNRAPAWLVCRGVRMWSTLWGLAATLSQRLSYSRFLLLFVPAASSGPHDL